jgi:hypothetical protein
LRKTLQIARKPPWAARRREKKYKPRARHAMASCDRGCAPTRIGSDAAVVAALSGIGRASRLA